MQVIPKTCIHIIFLDYRSQHLTGFKKATTCFLLVLKWFFRWLQTNFPVEDSCDKFWANRGVAFRKHRGQLFILPKRLFWRRATKQIRRKKLVGMRSDGKVEWWGRFSEGINLFLKQVWCIEVKNPNSCMDPIHIPLFLWQIYGFFVAKCSQVSADSSHWSQNRILAELWYLVQYSVFVSSNIY